MSCSSDDDSTQPLCRTIKEAIRNTSNDDAGSQDARIET